MENKEDSRKAFELVASNNGLWPAAIARHKDGEYLMLQTASGWFWWQEAWQHQAARIAELEAQVKQLQRVPLSDGRLVEAIESFTGFISGDVDKFVAHIESAHGITQEKQG